MYSCVRNASQEDIIFKVEKSCAGKDTCKVDMHNLVKPDWDKMFIFKPNASLEFINSKIGFNYPYFNDVANRVVFIKGSTVVFHEDVFPSIETPNDNELIFLLPDTTNYAEFTVKTAKFSVTRTIVKGKNIFKATPIN